MNDNNLIYRAISFTDLESVGFKINIMEIEGSIKATGIMRKGERSYTLEKVLWRLGVLSNSYLTVERCEHVRLDGSRTTNYRFLGQERHDKEWLESGHASHEAQMGSSRMKDMVSYSGRLGSSGDR